MLKIINYRLRGFTIVELLIVIVVIGILAAIVIISYNGITHNASKAAKMADIAQWKTKAAVYRAQNSIDDCPTGYSFVYGNSTLGTSSFCVMRYEAKNVGGVATSQASGTPWVSITQTNAITASITAGGHLITEAEWMTIAADVLSIKYNWSGGAVGSGLIYQGHVNNNPASALAASDDESDTLTGITGGTGTTTGTNSSRVLYLSSGDTIWDFSGNVYEWTQIAIGTPTLNVSSIGYTGSSTYNWWQWNLDSLSLGNLPANSRPSNLSSIAGLGSIGSWNSTQGIGQLYANYGDTGARAFLRGGGWTDTSPAGILELFLTYAPSNSSAQFGFRVAR